MHNMQVCDHDYMTKRKCRQWMDDEVRLFRIYASIALILANYFHSFQVSNLYGSGAT